MSEFGHLFGVSQGPDAPQISRWKWAALVDSCISDTV
jgi:hypothetical protein